MMDRAYIELSFYICSLQCAATTAWLPKFVFAQGCLAKTPRYSLSISMLLLVIFALAVPQLSLHDIPNIQVGGRSVCSILTYWITLTHANKYLIQIIKTKVKVGRHYINANFSYPANKAIVFLTIS